MKQVDTKAYMTALRSLTEQGHSVSVPVAGSSMSPFLAGGRDTVFFSRPDTPLRRGDIVFYERASGQFVMHRIRRVHRDGSLDILGDAQTETETGILPQQVFARATAVCRKGRQLQPEIFCGSSFADRGCGSFRCGAPSSGHGAHSKSAGHNTITIQNYRLRKEKRSGFHFAFFILLGFRGCPARGALRRTHGRPA